MMKKSTPDGFDVAIVGGGIVGLALAWAASKKGLTTAVFERNPRPIGASVRNFGLIWPIGQGSATLARAMRTRELWLDLAQKTGLWHEPKGSLTLAYADDERDVLEEFFEKNRRSGGYEIELLDAKSVADRSPWAKTEGLKTALFSKTEINVDPRQAVDFLQKFLAERHGVQFFQNTAITEITAGHVYSGWREWRAERIFVASGADFETLFPDVFIQSGMTKCKLQMMRTAPFFGDWLLGPALCAGLTLGHYDAFSSCASLEKLKKRLAEDFPEHVTAGIHVLVSQTATGEMTLGDTHEYGLDISPFDKKSLNDLVLEYLKTFFRLPVPPISETWHGVYAKTRAGKTEFIHEPDAGVLIVNGLGGGGMTLSFGLAEEVLDGAFSKKKVAAGVRATAF